MNIAYHCIKLIYGYFTPILHPLNPSIGLNSWNPVIYYCNFATGTFIYFESYYNFFLSSIFGTNWFNGISNNLIITGLLSMDLNNNLKSLMWYYMIYFKYFSLYSNYSDKIIFLNYLILFKFKNICSVLYNPIP